MKNENVKRRRMKQAFSSHNFIFLRFLSGSKSGNSISSPPTLFVVCTSFFHFAEVSFVCRMRLARMASVAIEGREREKRDRVEFPSLVERAFLLFRLLDFFLSFRCLEGLIACVLPGPRAFLSRVFAIPMVSE